MARGQETNQFVNVRTQRIDYPEVRLLVGAFDVSQCNRPPCSQPVRLIGEAVILLGNSQIDKLVLDVQRSAVGGGGGVKCLPLHTILQPVTGILPSRTSVLSILCGTTAIEYSVANRQIIRDDRLSSMYRSSSHYSRFACGVFLCPRYVYVYNSSTKLR